MLALVRVLLLEVVMLLEERVAGHGWRPPRGGGGRRRVGCQRRRTGFKVGHELERGLHAVVVIGVHDAAVRRVAAHSGHSGKAAAAVTARHLVPREVAAPGASVGVAREGPVAPEVVNGRLWAGDLVIGVLTLAAAAAAARIV